MKKQWAEIIEEDYGTGKTAHPVTQQQSNMQQVAPQQGQQVTQNGQQPQQGGQQDSELLAAMQKILSM